VQPEGLKLHFNAQSERFTVDNLYRFECINQKDLISYFHYGLKNKIMSSHALNNSSSRSHCIMTITVESIEVDNPDNIVVSNLQLVDLAGSERSSQTTTDGKDDMKDRQLKKEAIDINKSLFTLRRVVSMLNKPDGGKKYIPYRESKLTSLLRHSLGGNSFCLMIACISPSSMFHTENVSTLSYASKASCISNKPIKNHDPKNKAIKELKKEVHGLREQLMMAHDLYGKSTDVCTKCGSSMSDLPQTTSLPEPQDDITQENVYGNHTPTGSRLQVIENSKTPELPDFKKMFEKNETMMDKMTDDLMSLKEIMSSQNKLGLFERILLSAKMVKNVLMRNMELNKDYMEHTLTIDDLQKQIGQLQLETEDVRDRLSIMEALTGTDSFYASMNYSHIKDEFSAEGTMKNKREMLKLLDQDKMIALIIEFNKENSILKKRIERFEKKKITNKFLQINDAMSSTAYTNTNNLSRTKYLGDSRYNTNGVDAGDQMYAIGYRCSTSPRHVQKESDAEPMR